jgi:hypothetical protein
MTIDNILAIIPEPKKIPGSFSHFEITDCHKMAKN